MINTVTIHKDSEPSKLAKAFRKALMTGGAVLELDAEMSPAELGVLRDRFQTSVKQDLGQQVIELIDAASQQETGRTLVENDNPRSVFLCSLEAEDSVGTSMRIQLAQRTALPEDLKFLLSRDKSPKVRFYARSLVREVDGD